MQSNAEPTALPQRCFIIQHFYMRGCTVGTLREDPAGPDARTSARSRADAGQTAAYKRRTISCRERAASWLLMTAADSRWPLLHPRVPASVALETLQKGGQGQWHDARLVRVDELQGDHRLERAARWVETPALDLESNDDMSEARVSAM